jgi:hypothetical protein
MAYDLLAEMVGLAIAGGSAATGLIQYRSNSRKANALRAAEEMDYFHEDKFILTAERLLDYEISQIAFEKTSGLIEEIIVQKIDFHLALRHHSVARKDVPGYEPRSDGFLEQLKTRDFDPQYVFSSRENYIRDVFDRFLGRLERIEALISDGVISAENFADHFSYWIKLIGDADTSLAPFDADKRTTLIKYINGYEFHGVIRLFARYGKDLSLPASVSRPRPPTSAAARPPPAPHR